MNDGMMRLMMGAGLLDGSMTPGQAYGGLLQAQQAGMQKKLIDTKIAEYERQNKEREARNRAFQGILGDPMRTAPFVPDQFPGEAPIDGLSSVTPATGMRAANAPMAGLLEAMGPEAGSKALMDMQMAGVNAGQPTNKMRNYQYALSQEAAGLVPKGTAANVLGGSGVNIDLSQNVPGMLDQFSLDHAKNQAALLSQNSLDANQQLAQAKRGLELLKHVNTGKWKPYTTEISRFFGVNPEDVGNTELFNQLSGEYVMGQIQNTKGAVSEKEMDYFAKISPGLDKTGFTNYVLFEIQRRKAIRNQNMPSRYYEYLQKNNGNPMGFNAWYMQNHDPFPEFNVDQLRAQYNKEVRGIRFGDKEAADKGYLSE